MSRKAVALTLAVIVLAGCSKLAEVTGLVPGLDFAVDAPSVVLADDTSQATAVLVHQGGRREPVTATWTSSDPTVISIGSDGRFVGHIEGRQATLTAKSQGQTASATISVRTDDRRLGYLLADQPTATGTYTPDATYSFNSSGGANSVTHTATGTYDVRFGGLAREAGEHDNVQTTAYNTTAVYCKPAQWASSGSDMVVTVLCFANNAAMVDSRFTILLIGTRPFGTQAPLAFVLAPGDTLTAVLDTLAAARNSTGGHILQGHVSEGSYALQFPGMGQASSGGPVGFEVIATGSGPRICRVIAADLGSSGAGINCARAGGQTPGDAAFSFLWLTHGKPGERFAYAWADNFSAASQYTPNAAYAYNSTGGTIIGRHTGTGLYQIVFAGLARPAGRKEIVGISSGFEDFAFGYCVIVSWGTSGTQDLAVNVSCFHTGGGPSNQRFNVYVIE